MAQNWHHTVCPHDCPSVCALEVEKTADGRLGKVKGSLRNPYTAGVVCAKVSRYAERYHHKDRLGHPMRRNGARGSGQFERITWDQALDEIADNLLKAEQKYGAETVWPYWYAGTMGFVQRDGINRLTHAKRYSRFYSTVCVTLADTGWRAGYGQRWGVSAEEAGEHSDLIVCWGGNPVSTNVNLMTHVSRAKKRGVPFVVIDPYRSPTAEQADMHLPVRPSTDGALACAVMHVLFRDGYADRAFLQSWTDAPDELEAHLKNPNTGMGLGDHRSERGRNRALRRNLRQGRASVDPLRIRLYTLSQRLGGDARRFVYSGGKGRMAVSRCWRLLQYGRSVSLGQSHDRRPRRRRSEHASFGISLASARF